ncbi:hypothetical protein IW152_005061 [Coemansia sp. BCRC 34962]|nr:hypothetical protein IW152_005061 [Coemansia sp. BCRC 34962]
MSLSDNGSTHNPNSTCRPSAPSPPPPLFQFTVPSGVAADGTTRPDIEVSVVSLARYTFADPVAAMNGPALLEPPAELGRIQVLGSTNATGYDDDGMIAEFTEDRLNRKLTHIARRLLLPDSYVEACYELHQFLGKRCVLEVESVQRNVFKCLKICARLSKLPGYSVQVMWQVIQQAHGLVDVFTGERAHAIELWMTKLTNRLRLMAVSPASDGSAPPRLPVVPPPELLDSRLREKLLPLPSMCLAALSDNGFDRAAGVSSAAHYLANPLSAATPSAGAMAAPLVLPPLPPLPPPPSGSEFASTSGGSPDPSEEPDLISTREAELAIIEHQLRELENVPAHRMGPMVRAALNLLVEMRFRLQLGLPRQTAAADEGSAAMVSEPVAPSSAMGFLVGGVIRGSGNDDETRIIDHVLDQISTTRRQQAQAQAQARAAADGAGAGLGAPLFMMSRLGSPYFTDASDYSDIHPPGVARQQQQRRRLAAPDSDRRRRRSDDSDSASANDEESASGDEESASGDEESVTGDESGQERRRRSRLRRRLLQI